MHVLTYIYMSARAMPNTMLFFNNTYLAISSRIGFLLLVDRIMAQKLSKCMSRNSLAIPRSPQPTSGNYPLWVKMVNLMDKV